VKTAAVVVAIVGALALQTTLSGMLTGGAIAVNLVLVAVVFLALSYGAVTGTLAGMVGGLAQDALAGGIVGLGGMTKTVIGFFVGVLGAQFNLSTTVPRLVMFVAATLVHQAVFEGLHALIGGRPLTLQWSAVLIQALANALLGIVAFFIVEKGPEAAQRRRTGRSSLSQRRY
jgi:rod shape-determining protein MreD